MSERNEAAERLRQHIIDQDGSTDAMMQADLDAAEAHERRAGAAPESESVSAIVGRGLESTPGFNDELRQARADLEAGKGTPFQEVRHERSAGAAPLDAIAAIEAIDHPCHDVCIGNLHADCQCAAWIQQEAVAAIILLDAAPAPSAGHEPHLGKHTDYACGFSGPHCWGCSEPWLCREHRRLVSLRAPSAETGGVE